MVTANGRVRPWLLRRRFRGAVVFLAQCAIVLTCVAVTTYAATSVQERAIRDATVQRVLDVATSLAELDQVQQAIGTPSAEQELQPLADIIAAASGVDYVVVTDADGIRITHPSPELRGQRVSTDPTEPLAGRVFVGTETGTIGPTLRAKVPVFRDGEVIGTASVGILESEITADHQAGIAALVPWVIAALLVGGVGASLLSTMVRRRVRALEAEVAELAVQRRMAQALREQTHEFRTRIHSIYGLIENGESQAALGYIADLAPVSDSEGITPDIGDARLRGVLAACESEMRVGGGSVEVDPMSSVPPGVITEDDVLVLANLVRNAMEATELRGNVSVLMHADEAGVEIVVGDDGPGVATQDLPHLFRHGFSTKAGQAPAERGVGLALVLQVVQARGGAIEVGRSPAGGARFAVTLPPVVSPGGGTGAVMVGARGRRR